MNRHALLSHLTARTSTVTLVEAIQAGPRWPKLTVAASWDTRGYTDWSDGTRTFKPPLKLEIETIEHQILPVARHYGLSVQSVMDMPFQRFHEHLSAMRDEQR